MEDFTNEFQKVLEPAGSSFSELNSNMELLHSFCDQHVFDYVSNTAFFTDQNISQAPLLTGQVSNQSLFCTFDQANVAEFCFGRHGKNVAPFSEFAELNTSFGLGPLGNESGEDFRTDQVHGTNGRKRKRKTDQGKVENGKEGIQVRAKRGQATDSHSLAERVRRERINEKLKVLQDLVPGCYKTMAMASMLDVIINYVRCLQNQIEFLSMKLSAASMFYDFSSPEAEAIETILGLGGSMDPQNDKSEGREIEITESSGGYAEKRISTAPCSANH